MKFAEELKIHISEAKTIANFLDACGPDDYQGEDNTITNTVKFPDGLEMDIKCCGCDEEASWTEAILFEDGCEVACSEVEETYLGKWVLEHGGNKYAVNVSVFPEEKEVIVIRHNETQKSVSLFSGLKAGDTVFQKGTSVLLADDAHYSGDSSYDGYLAYDVNDNGIFPEDLDGADTRYLLSRNGKTVGIIKNRFSRPCSMEGCTGMRMHVVWPDGKSTYPCSRGCECAGPFTERIV